MKPNWKHMKLDWNSIKHNKKKALTLTLVMALLVVACVGGTLAFFTDEAVVHNIITTNKIDIDLVEQMQQGVDNEGNPIYVDWPVDEGLSGVMPGADVSKIVSVTNNAGKAWVRIYVEWAIKDASGKVLSGHVNGVPLLTLDFNDEAWTLGEGGYWYYNEPLETGDSTEALFTKVNFSGAMDNSYQNCTATVTVAAEAVQFENNPIPEGGTVLDIPGWPTENN